MSDYDVLVSKYDDQTKMDIAAWVISKLRAHTLNGGSSRTLIYERLGFGVEAYGPLCEAGAVDVTNALFTAAKVKSGRRPKK
jgi:hypothetical protein